MSGVLLFGAAAAGISVVAFAFVVRWLVGLFSDSDHAEKIIFAALFLLFAFNVLARGRWDPETLALIAGSLIGYGIVAWIWFFQSGYRKKAID